MSTNKAINVLKGMKSERRSGFYYSLTSEQLDILHDLANVYKDNPEEIESRTWERVTKTFAPLLGRPRLAAATLKRAVTEVIDGKLKRK